MLKVTSSASFGATPERVLFREDDREKLLARIDQMQEANEMLADLCLRMLRFHPEDIIWVRKVLDDPRSLPTTERRTRSHVTPLVYYIKMGDLIKIGTSRSIISRMQSFYAPRENLLAVEPGSRDVEAQRHREFAHLRVGRSELFKAEEDLMTHIDALSDGVDVMWLACNLNGLHYRPAA